MQQINLYLPSLHPQKKWLTIKNIIIFALLVSMLIVYVFISEMNDLHRLEVKINSLELQQKHEASRIEKLQKSIRPKSTAQIDGRISDLKKQLETRKILERVIEGQNLGDDRGYSQALKLMAKHAKKTMSLDVVQYSYGVSMVEVLGVSNNIDDIPLFVDKLQREPFFDNSSFGLLSISNVKNNSRLHNFSIGFDSLLSQDDVKYGAIESVK